MTHNHTIGKRFTAWSRKVQDDINWKENHGIVKLWRPHMNDGGRAHLDREMTVAVIATLGVPMRRLDEDGP